MYSAHAQFKDGNITLYNVCISMNEQAHDITLLMWVEVG